MQPHNTLDDHDEADNDDDEYTTNTRASTVPWTFAEVHRPLKRRTRVHRMLGYMLMCIYMLLLVCVFSRRGGSRKSIIELLSKQMHDLRFDGHRGVVESECVFFRTHNCPHHIAHTASLHDVLCVVLGSRTRTAMIVVRCTERACVRVDAVRRPLRDARNQFSVKCGRSLCCVVESTKHIIVYCMKSSRQ